MLFRSNVDIKNNKVVTGTSRSIGMVGISDSLKNAEWNCETALEFVMSDGITVRHDIGTLALIQRRVDHMKEIRGDD